jgi:hypothetical protein
MTPSTIIQQARAAGVSLEISSNGNIKAVGDPAAVRRWLPTLRVNKAQIVCLLEDEHILRWLNALDATGAWTDPFAVEELMVRARKEPEVWAYYLRRAEGLFMPQH